MHAQSSVSTVSSSVASSCPSENRRRLSCLSLQPACHAPTANYHDSTTTTLHSQPHMHAQSSVSTVSSSVVLSGLSASLIVRRVCLVCRQVVMIAICQNTLAAVEWQLRGSNPLSVSETSRASFCRCHVIACQQKMCHVFTPAAMWQLRGSNPLGA